MSKKITEIEGIGPANAEKLSEAGITTVEKLLELGGPKAGRVEVSTKAGVSEQVVLDWVNMADLFRIKGVAGQFAELLKAAGVDTVKELAQRNPENLHEMLVKTNAEKNLTNTVPGVEKIEDFVAQAKELEPAVFH